MKILNRTTSFPKEVIKKIVIKFNWPLQIYVNVNFQLLLQFSKNISSVFSEKTKPISSQAKFLKRYHMESLEIKQIAKLFNSNPTFFSEIIENYLPLTCQWLELRCRTWVDFPVWRAGDTELGLQTWPVFVKQFWPWKPLGTLCLKNHSTSSKNFVNIRQIKLTKGIYKW